MILYSALVPLTVIAGVGSVRTWPFDQILSTIGLESPGQSDRDPVSHFHWVVNQLDELRLKVANMNLPQYLSEHKLYDTSSKQALIELATWLFEHDVPVPLFNDRVNGDSDSLNSAKPKVCVSIASTKRPGSPFSSLIQAVSSILNRMNFHKYKDNVYIHVFNMDNDPEENLEADIVSYFVPVSDAKVPISAPDKFPVKPHYRENLDNAYIVRTLHEIGCEYPILLEDDSLATTDWMDAVSLAIDQLKNYGPDSWFMVRLFTARPYYPPLLSRGINDYDPLFNMVACLLNRKYMVAFSDELEKTVSQTLSEKNHDIHLPKDGIAHEFSRSHNLKMLAYEPVIFQHTGLFSSVSDRTVDGNLASNWIMFSQYFDAKGQPVVFDPRLWVH